MSLFHNAWLDILSGQTLYGAVFPISKFNKSRSQAVLMQIAPFIIPSNEPLVKILLFKTAL